MRLSDLEKKISNIPIGIYENKESLLCVNKEINIIEDNKFLLELDNPYKRIPRSNYAFLENSGRILKRFPKVKIKEQFWELNFNEHLASKFTLAKKLFLNQSQVKEEIFKAATKSEVIVLFIIDGLSYIDCSHWKNVRPCLVDTTTITESGFLNLVGSKKNISNSLFSVGFRNFYGFSYWNKDEKNFLTDKIFTGFGSVLKIESFNDVINNLNLKCSNKTFIQIVTQGLDGIAHKCRDEPLIGPKVNQLENYIKILSEILIDSQLKYHLYVTSDHGILWKHRNKLKKIPIEKSFKSFSPRYYESGFECSEGTKFLTENKNYVSLHYPFISRELRSNEWGVHGGISLEESIVPFIKYNSE